MVFVWVRLDTPVCEGEVQRITFRSLTLIKGSTLRLLGFYLFSQLCCQNQYMETQVNCERLILKQCGPNSRGKRQTSVSLFMSQSLVMSSTRTWPHHWHFSSPTWTLPSESIYTLKGSYRVSSWAVASNWHSVPSRFPHLLQRKARTSTSIMALFILFS